MQSKVESNRPLNPSADLEQTGLVYEVNPLSDLRWKTLVETHPAATVFHTTNWLNALQRTYGYQPTVLTLTGPDKPLENGIVLCRVSSWLTGNRLVSVPFSDHCQPLVHETADLIPLLSSLKTRIGYEGCKYVEMRPLKPLDIEIESRALLAPEDSFCIHLLDLRSPADELFKGFHKNSVRAPLRRSQREGVRIEEGRNEVLLKAFYDLLILTRRRHRIPPQPMEWFRNLIDFFGDGALIRVAYKDRVPIASILTLAHNRSVVYKYGCSDPSFNNSGATAALIWHAIQAAQKEGFEQFDFGRSELENTGLITFKDHWGATRTALRYYRYPWASSTLNRSALKGFGERVAQRIVPYLPDAVLTSIGKLLYKHAA